MSSTVAEQTKKRPMPKQINRINSKSKEADATEPDKLFACRGNCGKCSNDFFSEVKMQRRESAFSTVQ